MQTGLDLPYYVIMYKNRKFQLINRASVQKKALERGRGGGGGGKIFQIILKRKQC